MRGLYQSSRTWLTNRGISYTVVYMWMARVWQTVSAPITLSLILYYLSPEEQGYYYTFYSVMGAQVFFELGLSQVLSQIVSHEAAFVTLFPGGVLAGSDTHRQRVLALGRLGLLWYACIGLVLLATLVVGGTWFFSGQSAQVHWLWPWRVVVVFFVLNLMTYPLYSLLEGCNHIRQVQGWRLLQTAVSGILLWIGLSLRLNLFAMAVQMVSQWALSMFFLFWRYPELIKSIYRFKERAAVSWWREVFPLQWRIAVSWICGYFYYTIYTPLLFHFCGPVAAGQFGFSMGLASAVTQTSQAPILAKAPLFGNLVARRKYRELDRTFNVSLATTAVLAVIGSVVLGIIVWMAASYFPRISTRFLSIKPFSVLLVVSVIYAVQFSLRTYLVAHKKDPLVVQNVVVALVGGTLAFLLVKPFGVAAMVGVFAAGAVVGLIWSAVTFKRCRREWHREPEVIN